MNKQGQEVTETDIKYSNNGTKQNMVSRNVFNLEVFYKKFNYVLTNSLT